MESSAQALGQRGHSASAIRYADGDGRVLSWNAARHTAEPEFRLHTLPRSGPGAADPGPGDLTVVSGYRDCFILLVILAVVSLAAAVFAI